MPLIQAFKCAWEDIFGSNTKKSFIKANRRINVSNQGNYYVSFSSFKGFEISENYEGVITIVNVESNIFIESSFFSNIALKGAGETGAIYMISRTNCNIALRSVCAAECYVTNNIWCNFLVQRPSDNAINHFNTSATCRCGKAINNIEFGNIVCDGVNSSNNNCIDFTGLVFESPTTSSVSMYCFIGNGISSITNSYVSASHFSNYFVFYQTKPLMALFDPVEEKSRFRKVCSLATAKIKYFFSPK